MDLYGNYLLCSFGQTTAADCRTCRKCIFFITKQGRCYQSDLNLFANDFPAVCKKRQRINQITFF